MVVYNNVHTGADQPAAVGHYYVTVSGVMERDGTCSCVVRLGDVLNGLVAHTIGGSDT